MDIFKDNIGYGNELNQYFGSVVDFRDAHCYKINGFIWAIHSYRERYGGMCNAFQAEITVLRLSGQCTRGMIRPALQGFFDSYEGNDRLTALISPENPKAIRMAKISGFVLEGRIRRSDKKNDQLIFSILREEYEEKWEN